MVRPSPPSSALLPAQTNAYRHAAEPAGPPRGRDADRRGLGGHLRQAADLLVGAEDLRALTFGEPRLARRLPLPGDLAQDLCRLDLAEIPHVRLRLPRTVSSEPVESHLRPSALWSACSPVAKHEPHVERLRPFSAKPQVVQRVYSD